MSENPDPAFSTAPDLTVAAYFSQVFRAHAPVSMIRIPPILAESSARLCVAWRNDLQINLAQMDGARYTFDLLDGLPKSRVLQWSRFRNALALPPENEWARPIRNALQY